MKNETIVDRVVDRIKSQAIGDLIREEDLYDIIKEAIPKVFFERREIKDSYGRSNGSQEPYIVEVLREVLQEQAKIAVKQWFTENSDELLKYWNEVFDKGLLTYVQNLQQAQMTSHISLALSTLVSKLNQERSAVGLPYLTI